LRGYVCEVRCGYVGSQLDRATREANAKLIAAAPDLLETLWNLVFAAGHLGTATDGMEEIRPQRQAVVDAMNAAADVIAKARGEQVSA
jgi:hypothetical protein